MLPYSRLFLLVNMLLPDLAFSPSTEGGSIYLYASIWIKEGKHYDWAEWTVGDTLGQQDFEHQNGWIKFYNEGIMAIEVYEAS